MRTLLRVALIMAATAWAGAAPARAVTPVAAGKLPASFSWGVAGSAYQSEGGFTNSNWDVYNAKPGQDPYGRSVDFLHRYRDDIRLAKRLGITQFRFGVNWARVEPEPGRFSAEALAYYDDLMQAIVDAGMRPQPTLDHWVYPKWVYDQDAWNNPKTVDDFLAYVKVMAEHFKGHHAAYLTFNEPFFYLVSETARRPGTLQPLMSAHLIDAHRRAYDAIHAIDPTAQVSSNFVWIAKNSPAAATSDALFMDGVRDKLDFAAFDYYYESTGDAGLTNILLGTPWKTPQYPQGIYVALHEVAEQYPGLPIYISENGMPTEDGKPRADGWTRSRALADTVYWVQRAWAEGIDVRGYQYWSLTDNFEFGSYTPRFGLYTVDALKDPSLTRRPTDAVETFHDIIARRGVASSYRPSLLRCSDSSRALTCPDRPDPAVVRRAPAGKDARAVTLRLRRSHGRWVAVARLRGFAAGTARVRLLRGTRVAARRTVRIRAGKATVRLRARRPGRYRVAATQGGRTVRSARKARR